MCMRVCACARPCEWGSAVPCSRVHFISEHQGVAIASGAAHGTGVYVSEDSQFAMAYLKGGAQCLLFAKVILSSDAKKVMAGAVIQQLILQNPAQVLPYYVVHFASRGASRHGSAAVYPIPAASSSTLQRLAAMVGLGGWGGNPMAVPARVPLPPPPPSAATAAAMPPAPSYVPSSPGGYKRSRKNRRK
jgi:hypothetical protein